MTTLIVGSLTDIPGRGGKFGNTGNGGSLGKVITGNETPPPPLGGKCKVGSLGMGDSAGNVHGLPSLFFDFIVGSLGPLIVGKVGKAIVGIAGKANVGIGNLSDGNVGSLGNGGNTQGLPLSLFF